MCKGIFIYFGWRVDEWKTRSTIGCSPNNFTPSNVKIVIFRSHLRFSQDSSLLSKRSVQESTTDEHFRLAPCDCLWCFFLSICICQTCNIQIFTRSIPRHSQDKLSCFGGRSRVKTHLCAGLKLRATWCNKNLSIRGRRGSAQTNSNRTLFSLENSQKPYVQIR